MPSVNEIRTQTAMIVLYSWNRLNWCVALVMLFRQQHTVCVTESEV